MYTCILQMYTLYRDNLRSLSLKYYIFVFESRVIIIIIFIIIIITVIIPQDNFNNSVRSMSFCNSFKIHKFKIPVSQHKEEEKFILYGFNFVCRKFIPLFIILKRIVKESKGGLDNSQTVLSWVALRVDFRKS